MEKKFSGKIWKFGNDIPEVDAFARDPWKKRYYPGS
jgi:hypothetical protein